MQIGVSCESPLLQRSLELFLAPHLSSLKHCDCIVKDHVSEDNSHSKPIIRIGSDRRADVVKPFSKSQLIYALEQFYKANSLSKSSDTTDEEPAQVKADFHQLEQTIDELTQSYKESVLRAVKAFYGE